MTPIRHPQRQAFARMFALQTVGSAVPESPTTDEAGAAPGADATGLLDGVTFRRAFHRHVSQRLRSDEPLTLAVLGLDDRATIEREHGSGLADRAAAAISRQLNEVFRTSDLLAHWGQHAFAVLMPATAVAGGLRAVEKALLVAYSAGVPLDGGQALQVSLSAGVVPVSRAMPFLEAVEQAEALLSLAQRRGPGRLRWPEGEIAVTTRRMLAITCDPTLLVRLEQAPATFQREAVEPAPHVITVAERAAPGLILLDVDSAGDAAWELLNRLRSSPRLGRLPILVISREPNHLVRSFAAGADDFVLGSASDEELRARADRLLCRRRDVLIPRIA